MSRRVVLISIGIIGTIAGGIWLDARRIRLEHERGKQFTESSRDLVSELDDLNDAVFDCFERWRRAGPFDESPLRFTGSVRTMGTEWTVFRAGHELTAGGNTVFLVVIADVCTGSTDEGADVPPVLAYWSDPNHAGVDGVLPDVAEEIAALARAHGFTTITRVLRLADLQRVVDRALARVET